MLFFGPISDKAGGGICVKSSTRAGSSSGPRTTYRTAGVHRQKADRLVPEYSRLANSASTQFLLSGIGPFAACLTWPKDIEDPALVISMDGVGSKSHLAVRMRTFEGLGTDLVAANVHDVMCGGATPLAVLDYVAVGRLNSRVAESLVASVADACRRSGVALAGGETAEIPAVYGQLALGDFVGCAVGVVSRTALAARPKPAVGDQFVALPSSGIHANGLTLALALLEDRRIGLGRPGPRGLSWGEELLRPSALYAPAVDALLRRVEVKALVHVTGGGLRGNVPRVLFPGQVARFSKSALPQATAPLWRQLADFGPVTSREMASTFNLGVGMVAVVASEEASAAVDLLQQNGFPQASVVGEVVKGKDGARPSVRWRP